MTKRRDKIAMLRRAFERVGFTGVKVEQEGKGFNIYYHREPLLPYRSIRQIKLQYFGDGAATGGRYIHVRWTAAFERWYQEEFGTDG